VGEKGGGQINEKTAEDKKKRKPALTSGGRQIENRAGRRHTGGEEGGYSSVGTKKRTQY